MRWADARGDSFGLSRLAADQTEAEFIVFCGVHFMAESADVLTGDHQKVVLPDLNAGCSMADMADIDQVEEAWEDLARGGRRRPPRPRDLHELRGGPEGLRRSPRRGGLHVVERPGRARPGRSSTGERVPLLPRPASRPQHRLRARLRLGRHVGVEPAAGPGRPHRSPRSRSRRCCCGRGTAPCTSASGPSTSRPSAPSTPTGS